MSQIQNIQIKSIRRNPEQPRTVFKEKEIQELGASIKERGLKQPISVYVDPGDDGKTYTLIMGERRLRAHAHIGAQTINAIVYETKPSRLDLLTDAMIENVQREDMNIVDEGEGYKVMRDEFKLTIRSISKRTGVYERRISVALSVADLEKPIKELIRSGSIPGSDRAISAYTSIAPGKTRIEFCKTAAQSNATIRMIESAARKLNAVKTFSSSVTGKEVPAISVAKTRMGRKADSDIKLSEWNALSQVGKVPPWLLFTKQVEATCDNCSLRSVASPSTCSDCPLVDMVRRSLEAAHA